MGAPKMGAPKAQAEAANWAEVCLPGTQNFLEQARDASSSSVHQPDPPRLGSLPAASEGRAERPASEGRAERAGAASGRELENHALT